jgi:hypothetical protein
MGKEDTSFHINAKLTQGDRISVPYSEDNYHYQDNNGHRRQPISSSWPDDYLSVEQEFKLSSKHWPNWREKVAIRQIVFRWRGEEDSIAEEGF